MAVKDGKTRCGCIRKLQMTQAGRRSTRTNTVYDENGVLLATPEETRGRWFRHFQDVLNLKSIYNQDVLAQMPIHPIQFELDKVPSSEELESALQSMKLGKAGVRLEYCRK